MDKIDLIIHGIQALNFNYHVVVIPAPKVSKPDKPPFFLTEQQFPLGMPNIAEIARYNKKILKSSHCFIF